MSVPGAAKRNQRPVISSARVLPSEVLALLMRASALVPVAGV